MKVKVLYPLFSVCTFSVGLLAAVSLSPQKQVQVTITGRPETQSPLRNIDPPQISHGTFVYPDPLYSFPRRGIYFSTSEYGESESVFQFELPFELAARQSPLPANKNSRGLTGRLNGREIKFDAIEIDIPSRTIVLWAATLGHQYVFRGQFRDKSYLESEYLRQVVLTGTLQESVLGRTVSEQDFEFWYAVGC